ncbi:L,D-transpeptidase [Aurantimonas sp. HBX-1]|uniref:L,D-transpeptidase n=1 Tax=Aurantimonas sp. HBX-1 TaxID=2906072 RepID=UPI001F2D39C4|nr:L,D-transpeptidase [Aurantimonas sp. HBX-1]UIJ71282.1 L,D-transpeptidase [Aurantimonas sp. HBX-1]
MRRILALSAAALAAIFAQPVPVPAQQLAVEASPSLRGEWILQLSPGSGVVPGYRRPHMNSPTNNLSGAVLGTRPVAVGRARPVLRGQPVGARQLVRYPSPALDPRYVQGVIGARPGFRPGQPQQVALQRPRQMVPQHHLDPVYLPQDVAYQGKETPGTIVVDTGSKFLYHVGKNGTARRYGVGVGKPGFAWKGRHPITRKAEWPSWTPPKEMIVRERRNGRILPAHMKGGEANPLGARALYLGSTLYRIHGTNQPWTIGQSVSSGCIRMRNQDVMELYERVNVGTKVVVR